MPFPSSTFTAQLFIWQKRVMLQHQKWEQFLWKCVLTFPPPPAHIKIVSQWHSSIAKMHFKVLCLSHKMPFQVRRLNFHLSNICGSWMNENFIWHNGIHQKLMAVTREQKQGPSHSAEKALKSAPLISKLHCSQKIHEVCWGSFSVRQDE